MDFEIEYLLALQEMRNTSPDIITTVLSTISTIGASLAKRR